MKKYLLAILIIGAAIISAACSKPSMDVDAESDRAPVPDKTVEAFGIVEASDIESISLDIEAVVEEVIVKEGQQVKKGDALLSLNMKEYKESMKGKQHELNIIRLEAKEMDNESSDPDIKKLENDLNFINIQMQEASKELEAQESLYKCGAISQYEYDKYIKAVDDKKKSAEDIKYKIDSIIRGNDIGSAIQSEKAAAMESEIRQMKDKINKDYISGDNIVCAMENGIVNEIGYKAGEAIIPGKKLISLLNSDTIVVKADVAEEFIKDVKQGARVEIIPVADKGRKYNGKVISIARKAIVQNGETIVPVEISIGNRDSFLLPNFNVDVKIYME